MAKGQAIRDHGDELAVGGLALDIAHGIPEVLLQHLDVAAVPGHLDGVADFRDFRPEREGSLSAVFCSFSMHKGQVIYWPIHWLGNVLFVGTLV